MQNAPRVKPVLNGHSKRRPKFIFNTDYHLMQVKSIAECSKGKTCLKLPLKKKTKIDFQYQLSLNAGQKYCRMLQGEHSAILSTFIKLLLAFKTFVLSNFEWSLKTDFTVTL